MAPRTPAAIERENSFGTRAEPMSVAGGVERGRFVHRYVPQMDMVGVQAAGSDFALVGLRTPKHFPKSGVAIGEIGEPGC